jgi:hypothetical protein
MRKPLILVLIAIGSGASYAAGVSEVATGPSTNDPSTWRWQVNTILAEQSVTVSRPSVDRSSFDQGYDRYSPLGLLEPQRDHSR